MIASKRKKDNLHENHNWECMINQINNCKKMKTKFKMNNNLLYQKHQ
jgi:hypothetical protein